MQKAFILIGVPGSGKSTWAGNMKKLNEDIIFDATNVSIKDRKQFLQLTSYCKNKPTKIAVVFNAPIEECVLRDFNRERTVGKQVIEKFKNKYSTPSIEEGFDIILNGNLDLNDYKK